MVPELNERYVGLVKWFYDENRKANYGFIHHIKYGDLFFHERSIDKDQRIKDFVENKAVSFNIQPSARHSDKYEAFTVRLLSSEPNLTYLFQIFLDNLKTRDTYSDYKVLQKALHERISILFKSLTDIKTKKELIQDYLSFITKILLIYDNTDRKIILEGVLKVGKNLFNENYSEIADSICSLITDETAYDLWLNNYLPACPVTYATVVFLQTTLKEQVVILEKCFEDEKSNILFNVALQYEQNPSLCIPDQYYSLFDLTKKFIPSKLEALISLVETSLSIEVIYEIWLRNFTQSCPINYVTSILIQQDRKYQDKVLKRCNEQERLEILTKIAINFQNRQKVDDIQEHIILIELSKAHITNDYHTIIDVAIGHLPAYFKLDLWLREYHDTLDFNLYRQYVSK